MSQSPLATIQQIHQTLGGHDVSGGLVGDIVHDVQYLRVAAALRDTGKARFAGLIAPYVKVEGGYVTLPELPGIGFEGKADLYAEMKALGEA